MLAKGTFKRFIYVCGDSVALRERIVDSVKKFVAPDDQDYVSYSLSDTSESEVWAALNQYHYQRTLIPGVIAEQPKRLVVVRDAQQLSDWKPVLDWMESAIAKKLMPSVYVMFVSNEPSWPEDKMPDVREKVFKAGMFIRCLTPVSDKAVALLLSESEQIDKPRALHLLNRVGWDIERALDCLVKASYFKGMLSEKIIDALATPKLADEFTTYLMAMDKPHACYAAASVEPTEYQRIISQLFYRLEAVQKITAAIRTTEGDYKSVMMKAKLPVVVFKSLYEVARYYGPDAIPRKIEALTFADSVVHKGNADGILEALVTLW